MCVRAGILWYDWKCTYWIQKYIALKIRCIVIPIQYWLNSWSKIIDKNRNTTNNNSKLFTYPNFRSARINALLWCLQKKSFHYRVIVDKPTIEANIDHLGGCAILLPLFYLASTYFIIQDSMTLNNTALSFKICWK